MLANGGIVYSQGSGNVRIDIRPKSMEERTVELHDVLYLPGLDENLVSVHKLTQKGYKVLFDGDNCYLMKGKDKMNVASYANGLYRVRLSTEVKAHSAKEHKNRCVHDWHKILAHRNLLDIRAMRKVGLVIRDCSCDDACEECIMGKISKRPFPKRGTPPQDVLECIATDVCGPMQVESIGRSKYFITFTDTFSDYSEVYFMKSKDQAATVIKQFVEKLKNQTGRKPKVLRSDRGTEYLNQQVQKYLADEGIKFQCTVGYAPQQNGYAERKNRTLVEAARTMLKDARLPKSYWAEAVRHACYVNNRLINNKNKLTPLEMFMGTKPSYQDLHQFGCDVYVMIPYEKRQKLDDKAAKATFVGYDEISKGYRVTNRETRKFTVSRDVIFFKTITVATNDEDMCEAGDLLTIPNEEVIPQNEEEQNNEDEDEFFDAEDHINEPRRSTRSNLGQPPIR